MSPLQSMHNTDAGHRKIIEGRDGVSFHQDQANREKAEPGYHSKFHRSALDMGQRNADDFLNKADDHTHPSHVPALEKFGTDFGYDRTKVGDHFKQKAVELMSAERQELRNSAYEKGVLSNYKISTQQDMATMAKFNDYMKTKWNAVGYKNDGQFIKHFTDCHPMPAKLRNDTISTI
jgi:hypothetical protein